MLVDKKEFALSQIAPYVKDFNNCGFDPIKGTCVYRKDGKMCVVGKNLSKKGYFLIESKKLLDESVHIIIMKL